MNKYIQLILCKIRLLAIKITHRNSKVSFIGYSNISGKTMLEIGDKSTLIFGRGVRVRDGVVLSVRDNSSLILGNGVFINRNTIITARKSIVIEDGVTIGANVCIYDHDHDIHNRGGIYLMEL